MRCTALRSAAPRPLHRHRCTAHQATRAALLAAPRPLTLVVGPLGGHRVGGLGAQHTKPPLFVAGVQAEEDGGAVGGGHQIGLQRQALRSGGRAGEVNEERREVNEEAAHTTVALDWWLKKRGLMEKGGDSFQCGGGCGGAVRAVRGRGGGWAAAAAAASASASASAAHLGLAGLRHGAAAQPHHHGSLVHALVVARKLGSGDEVVDVDAAACGVFRKRKDKDG